MNVQLELNEPLTGRSLKSGLPGTAQLVPVPSSDTGRQRDDRAPTIEIGKLPMVRKGGPMALIFDRMDANANGVLTRAELISYRLKPMVTEMTIPTPAMPEESMRQAARAAEANIHEAGQEDAAPVPAELEGATDPAPTTAEQAPPLPIFKPTVTTGAATPDAPPASLPESIVMAQTVDAPAPIAA